MLSIRRWSLKVYTWRKILSMLLVLICHLASLEIKCLASLSDRRTVCRAGSDLWWHQLQQTGGTKVFIMCATKSIYARGGLSKRGWTEVWPHTSVSRVCGGTRQHRSGWICPLEYTDVSPSSFTRPRFPLNQELNADLDINLRCNLEDDWKCEWTFESDPPPLRTAPFTRLFWGWMGSETKNMCCHFFRMMWKSTWRPIFPRKDNKGALKIAGRCSFKPPVSIL